MANPSILAFSTTAADNGSGVTGVNAAENQPPSTVNDGVRGLMARLAYWRNWQAGNVTQGGTGNAYTFTSGETLTAYSNGMRIAWKPNATATGAVTLNVDSIGAKKVYRPDGTQAGAGDVISGTIVDLVYQSALDSAAGGFQMVGTGRALSTGLYVSATARLVGRASSGAGASEEISLAGGLEFNATTLRVGFTATDKLLGRSSLGAGAAEEITCTAAGRALIDDADAATQRTTLGLGTAAVKNTGASGDAVPLLNVANTWSAAQRFSAAPNINNNVAINLRDSGDVPRSGLKMSTSDALEVGVGSIVSQYKGYSHSFDAGGVAGRVSIDADGGLMCGSPSGGSKGPGTLNATAVYDDNVLLTDLVLDHAVDGAFDREKYKGHPIAGEIEPHWFDADAYARHWQAHRRLPGMVSWEDPAQRPSSGEMITRLLAVAETQAVLIEGLNQRIRQLERRGQP